MVARMNNDYNYILYVTSNIIAECVNECVHVCIREGIMVMCCLAMMKTIIVLKTEYCTDCLYSLINALLYKSLYISNCRGLIYNNVSGTVLGTLRFIGCRSLLADIQ